MEQHKRRQDDKKGANTTRVPSSREIDSGYLDTDHTPTEGSIRNARIMEIKPSCDEVLIFQDTDFTTITNGAANVCDMEIKSTWWSSSQHPDNDDIIDDVTGLYLQSMTYESNLAQSWVAKTETETWSIPSGIVPWLDTSPRVLTFGLDSPLVPPLMPQCQIKQRFDQLVKTWKSEAEILSTIRDKSMHPAYQEIIGMGKEAIPLILNQMSIEPDHWFWALNATTGEDPIPEEAKGDIIEMTKAWLEWGELHGFSSLEYYRKDVPQPEGMGM